MNRGSLELLVPLGVQGLASMRPRFMNRGSRIITGDCLAELPLQ